MRTRKRHVYRSYVPVTGTTWQAPTGHQHDYAEKEIHYANQIIVVDTCTKEGCRYERARDLITPKGGAHGSDPGPAV